MLAQELQDEVSYSNDIAPIVENFCITCHAGDEPEGDLRLTSYAAVRREAERGDLLARINDHKDPMPEDGLLPMYMRRMFQAWADKGYLKEGTGVKPRTKIDYGKFTPPTIRPVDINQQGFELLTDMQGHWVGSLKLMGQDWDWFAFDYRAIGPAHVHGIFEGGTIGNLFTSFFVTEFKGTRTIMARNGGLLNGIYRTSYFVLDEVRIRRGQRYYRLVDAYGGKGIMWMELTFSGDRLEFNSYTSRFGLKAPKLHMAFKAKRTQPELAAQAAKAVGFPKNVIEFDFSKGLPKPEWGEDIPLTSASYIWQEPGKSLIELAKLAKDPYRIDHMPHVGQLSVEVKRHPTIAGKKLHMYLSSKALTDAQGNFITRYGYVREELLNTLLHFPEISGKQDSFTFTYLHPGDYFLTVVADMDADGFPSPEDITHPRILIRIGPKEHERVAIRDLNVRN